MDKVRVCKDCGRTPQQAEFGKHPGTWDKLSIVCKECNRKRSKASEAKYSEEKALQRRVRHREPLYKHAKYIRLFGISYDQFKDLLQRQNNKCAICSKEFSDESFPHLDHDHQSKKVRGILCLNCNLGLGHLRDDISFIQQAISYLVSNANPSDEMTGILYRDGEKRLDVRSMRHLKISKDGRQRLFELQNHLCLICSRDLREVRFHLDHHHGKGHVRGLLCGNCNVGIGNFQEDVGFMRNAVSYLAAPPFQK